MKFLINFKINFSLFNTEETKSVIFLPIACKNAHIHDTGFIAQVAELLHVIPSQNNLS